MTNNLEQLTKEELMVLVRKEQQRGSTIKVSTKGAVSVYGLGKWPVTLYKSQWEKLLGQVPAIETFIKEHSAELAVKE